MQDLQCDNCGHTQKAASLSEWMPISRWVASTGVKTEAKKNKLTILLFVRLVKIKFAMTLRNDFRKRIFSAPKLFGGIYIQQPCFEFRSFPNGGIVRSLIALRGK